MQYSFARVALAVVAVAAGTAAQDPSKSERFPAPHVPASSTAGGGAVDAPRFDVDLGRVQDQDYSLRGLFQQHHGNFMLRRQRFDPLIEFRGQLMPDYAVDGERGHFDMLRGIADIDLPMMVSPDGYLLIGSTFDIRRLQTKNMVKGPLNLGDETLYQIGIKLGFGVFLSEDLLLEASVTPSIFSDMDATLHHKDYDYPARALFTWRTGEDFFFKIGARYNEIYDDAKVLPYLGFSWTPIPEWRVDILLPEMMETSWWPDPSFGMLLGIEVQGAQYRVHDTLANGSTPADIRLQEVIPYFGAMWRASDNFSLFGRVGLTVAGDYKLTDGVLPPTFIDGTLEPGIFFEVGMGFDF